MKVLCVGDKLKQSESAQGLVLEVRYVGDDSHRAGISGSLATPHPALTLCKS